MKKQLSYKAYVKNYLFIYLFLALLIVVCYGKGAWESWFYGENDIKWQEEEMNRYLHEERIRDYFSPGGFTDLTPYNVDYIVKKARQLDRGCVLERCGIIASCYYDEVALSGLWFVIALIIISQLPYATGKGREFLVQLPLTARRRYCYETLTNAVIAIGIPILISFVLMMIAMLKGYGCLDFLRIEAYMVVISLFCFSFITMFKEFHRNSLAGTLWGIIVLMALAGGIGEIMAWTTLDYNGFLPQWAAVLLSILFLFVGSRLAEGKRMEQPHAIRFWFVRIFMVVCFLYPNISGIISEGSGEEMVYGIIITVLWAIGFYVVIDLKYIGERIEDLLLRVRHGFRSPD